MALELNGTTGVSLVQDGVVTAADLSSTLDLTGKTVTLPAGVGGKVLQVVHEIITTEFIFNSSTYQDATNFNASITPTNSNSTVLVMADVSYLLDNFNTGDTEIGFRIMRGATSVFEGKIAAGYAGLIITSCPIKYEDSPATTSATTYKLQVKASSTYNNSRINHQGSYPAKSTLTLMEIAG